MHVQERRHCVNVSQDARDVGGGRERSYEQRRGVVPRELRAQILEAHGTVPPLCHAQHRCAGITPRQDVAVVLVRPHKDDCGRAAVGQLRGRWPGIGQA